MSYDLYDETLVQKVEEYMSYDLAQEDVITDEQDYERVGTVSLSGPYDPSNPNLDASFQFILENIRPKKTFWRDLWRLVRR